MSHFNHIHDQPNRFSNDGTSGVHASDQSDFSPIFWLEAIPIQGGGSQVRRRRGTTFAGIPLSYPLLVGLFLLFIVLMQRESFTFM